MSDLTDYGEEKIKNAKGLDRVWSMLIENI